MVTNMTTRQQIQSVGLPPAQPSYVLRGHDAQIHSVCFLRNNTRLLTGDAEGWLILWNIATKRPAVVWRAHEGAILGLGAWGADKIITHGRDTKVLVWQLREADESSLSSVLPVEDTASRHPDPWLLHSLEVNTLNFCSFAHCAANSTASESGDLICLAVPGRRGGEIEVYSLPGQDEPLTIKAPVGIKTGMVMALAVTYLHEVLVVIAGYENGYTCVWEKKDTASNWKSLYASKAHGQPVLSLDIAKAHDVYYTSAADAIIASHSLGLNGTPMAPHKQTQTKHSGQQSLTVRSDEKIFATAGWDGRIRVYSAKTLRELAVLKWHKEGCYALAFADLNPSIVGHEQASSDVSDSAITTVSHLTVEEKRNLKAQTTHWLAAGAKDGKISLWDIY